MTLEAVPPTPELSTEFDGHIKGLKALATIHDLLNKGSFPFAYRYQIELALNFVTELHKQSTESALEHPEADKVPELVALKEARLKEAVEQKTIAKAEVKRTRKATKGKK